MTKTQRRTVEEMELHSGSLRLCARRINGKLQFEIKEGDGQVGWHVDLTINQAREVDRVAGGPMCERSMTVAERQEAEYQALCAVARAAQALVDECKAGDIPPSLGALARLESALAVDWKLRIGSEPPPIHFPALSATKGET